MNLKVITSAKTKTWKKLVLNGVHEKVKEKKENKRKTTKDVKTKKGESGR